MTAKKVQPTRIDYPKHWFMVGTLMWAAATAALVYLAWSSISEVIQAIWIIIGLVEGFLLGYLLVLPLFTHHMLGVKGLKLRMGLSIDETIPYEWIKEVRETSITWGAIRVGIGVRYAPIMKVMFLTSSFQSLVKLKLDKEHRIGSPFKRPVEEIVLSVFSATVFMDQLRERTGATEEV
jgi:hypothetical protein